MKSRDEAVVDENELTPLPDNDRITRTVVDKPDAVNEDGRFGKEGPAEGRDS
jgi:hypothetical protein